MVDNKVRLKNGLELTISKAKKEDAADIIEYLKLIGGESDNLLFGANEFDMSVADEENMIENFSKSTTSAILVGKINGEIVSITTLMSPRRERIAHQSEIAISVKKKYWNNGIATHMMNKAISFAKQNGVTTLIHLRVKEDNTNAIYLYEKLGFERIGVYKKFFKIEDKYYDNVLMNLYL